MITAVVTVYLAVMVGIGVLVSRRIKLASDFLVAGRKLGLVLTTATLAAVQIGAGVIVGGAEKGAANGIWPGMWSGIGFGGGLIVAGLLVAAKMRQHGGYVPLDFFGYRYGERKGVRIWAWLSNIPSLLGVFVAQLMAAGYIIRTIYLNDAYGDVLDANTIKFISIAIIGIVVVLYSVLGGMWGVVITDFIQVGIIVIGIPLVAWAAGDRLWEIESVGVMDILGEPFIPSGMGSEAVFLIVPFLLAISVSYDAFMRYQSARSARVAQWGCILSGILVIGISFCTAFAGAAGKKLYPEQEDSEVLTYMIGAMFHPVIGGIMVSAILAAAMSSANCLLISLSGTFTRDFYNKVLHPEAKLDDLKHSKILSRVVMVVALIIGIGLAFRSDRILNTIMIFVYPYMGSMLVPLLGGVLWKRATIQGALAAMFTGGAIGVVAFIGGVGKFFNIDLGLLIAYGVSAVVFVAVSWVTSKGFTDKGVIAD
ncbi:MAG: sodium:solute symporter family protein [Planctomycetes bacterium]|nr:sodium:solute symporter family protein [Planctomycetota bacterium]